MNNKKIVKTVDVLNETKAEVAVTEVPKKKRGRKPKVKEPKEKKVPSLYAQFVKENYHLSRDLPVKDRFKHIAVLWKAHKEKEDKK